MSAALQYPKPWPTLCLKCGYHFVPGAPEPCWCPDCGRLCSAYDLDYEEVPDDEPEECRETQAHVRGWWLWLWIMLVAGPVGALLIGLASKKIVKSVPPWLKEIAEFSTGGAGMACAIFFGAVGATYCLARLRRGQHRGESIVVVALTGFFLFLGYLVLCGMMVRTLLRLVQ